jgi:RNA polymerase sigma factor (sigma-70 family)
MAGTSDTARGHQHPRLADAFGSGAREHPSIALPERLFAEHVELMAGRQAVALAPATPAERRDWLLSHALAGELYLAAACEHGTGGAWERFAQCLLPWLRGLLERRGARPAEVESLVGETPGWMLLPPRSRVARTTIGTWDGRARLTSWLAAITLRRWVGQRSQVARPAELSEDAQPPRRRPAPEPLEVALGQEACGRLLAALDAAWDGLTPRERLALLLRYKGGLPQKRVAALLGVGEPRVSRLLSSAVARLRAATDATFDAALAATPALAGAVAAWLAIREGGVLPRDVHASNTEASGDA